MGLRIKQASLDDCALTLREVLRHHKSTIKPALERHMEYIKFNDDTMYNLRECGVVISVSIRLLKLFLVEEALE